tara:strand:+ start:2531 stop:2917 length:387 start_codon:yes stop_codon:yes gene_type:complete
MTKYLILDADNQIVGWSQDSSVVSQAQTDLNIPSYDIKTQSIFWENDSIVVKDDDVKIKNESEKPMRLLRQQRNQKLSETDWMANSDVVMSDDWKTYRQALRDLPSTTEPKLDEQGLLTNITWPTKPE